MDGLIRLMVIEVRASAVTVTVALSWTPTEEAAMEVFPTLSPISTPLEPVASLT